MTSQPSSESPARVGDYTVLTLLGEGGMGVVHLARGADGRRVALKVLRPHIVGDQEARARLAREVSSLGRVRSPWVAEILDADPWADVPYVVTRYVPGLSLHDHVLEEGPVEDRDLYWLAGCLAEGIAAVHAAGVLHRDVKPSNVLMEGRTPILIDFGLARVAEDPRLTHTGWLLGTPGYLAPEILYGDDATPATDVHAWAATVAYAALGRPPYGRGPAMAIMDRARRGEHDLSGLSGPLAGVLDAALDPDPLARPLLAEILDWVRPLSTQPDTPVGVPPVAGAVGIDRDDFTLPLAIAAGLDTPSPGGSGYSTTEPGGSSRSRGRSDRIETPEPRTLVMPTEVGPPAVSAPAVAHPPPPPASAAPTIGPAGWEAPPPVASPAFAQWEEAWAAAAYVEPAPRLGERLRRLVAVGCGAVLLGAAAAAAPYVTAVAVVLLVWLLRAGSLAASAVADRRALRGRKWYDGLRLALSSPWHLVRAITGTVVLALWSAGLAVAAALICYAAAAGTAVTLFTGGAAFGVALWSGPSSGRFKGPLSRVLHPLARRGATWLLLCGVLLAAAAGLGLLVSGQGVGWLPADGPPFRL